MRERLMIDLLESRVVAIIRKLAPEHLPNVAAALVDGGIRTMEVTLDTPGALGMIERLAKDPRIAVGAGTVLDPESARLAILAGARLIVTPTFSPAVIRTARRYGALVIPGAMTPTEILAAWECGADAVKLFPASSLGPRYVREVKGPLPQVRIMATGGVTPENARDYIQNGADLLGVGGALVDRRAIENEDYLALAETARRLTEAVASVTL
jgi:2-dehydro-3-deoxyphosphogluconate aldolase/(4S)-4-hydroxy-2-oxoglutarate aldolase